MPRACTLRRTPGLKGKVSYGGFSTGVGLPAPCIIVWRSSTCKKSKKSDPENFKWFKLGQVRKFQYFQTIYKIFRKYIDI